MKKLLFLLVFLLCGMASVSAEVLSTDIGVLIDDSPIESYNIRDYTYVVAEDLVHYGFDVVWDGKARTLSIYHDVHKGYDIALTKEQINIKKADIPFRKHLYKVYPTDIKTYLEDKEIAACNIDGRTLIQIDELAQYGEFTYDDSRRMVELRIRKPSFEYGLKIAENKTDTVVTINPPRYARDVNYTGLVNADGVPDGIGKMTDPDWGSVTYAYWYSYIRLDNYYTENVDGERSERTYGYSGENLRHDNIISIYGDGTDPYTMTCTGRYEAGERYTRDGIYDNAYLYGFYIVNETYYDSEGMTINYSDSVTKPVTAIMADNRFRQINYIKTADGAIYAAGYDGIGNLGWSIQGGQNVKAFAKTTLTDFPEPPTAPTAENVVSYRAAEEAAYNRTISLAADGSVWFERTPGAFAEVNKEQSDGLDLSKPVKVFEGAKYVNIQLEDVGNVSQTAYIPYFYVVDEEDNLWYWNYEYRNQSQTGNEYDPNNNYIAYGRVPYVREPMKIAEGVKKAFGTETRYLLKTDGTVWRIENGQEEKILENVADMDADHCGRNFIALKKDGTLWTWGRNEHGEGGHGHTDIVWQPTQVEWFYEHQGY